PRPLLCAREPAPWPPDNRAPGASHHRTLAALALARKPSVRRARFEWVVRFSEYESLLAAGLRWPAPGLRTGLPRNGTEESADRVCRFHTSASPGHTSAAETSWGLQSPLPCKPRRSTARSHRRWFPVGETTSPSRSA